MVELARSLGNEANDFEAGRGVISTGLPHSRATYAPARCPAAATYDHRIPYTAIKHPSVAGRVRNIRTLAKVLQAMLRPHRRMTSVGSRRLPSLLS
jgi:hypothetical protein